MINTRRAWARVLPALLVGLSVGCAAVAPRSAETNSSARAAVPPATADLQQLDALPTRLDLPLVRRGGYLLVPGWINGQPLGLMMIDTGASIGVIAQGMAGRLDLPRGGRGRTVGVGGFEDFNYLTITDYRLGPPAVDGEVRGLRLEPRPMAELPLLRFGQSLGVSLAGIVAYTDLAALPFTLDAAGSTLTVYRPQSFRPEPGATRHRLRHLRRLPVVRATLQADGRPIEVDLIIDYGADAALTLPRSILNKHPGVVAVEAAGGGRTFGVGGSVDSTRTWLRGIRLLGRDLEHLPVSFETPPPSLTGPRPIGRIGNGLLQHFRLTFHASHGYLYSRFVPAEAAGLK